MANNTYEHPIDKHVNWGGDSVTGGKPVSGEYVQQFIKESLESKIGYMHLYTDERNNKNKYFCFADKENCDKYLLWLDDKANEEYEGYDKYLIAEFDAPAPFTASIKFDEEHLEKLSTLLNGSSNNVLVFGYEIQDSRGNTQAENAKITFTVALPDGNTATYTETYTKQNDCQFNLDNYIKTGGIGSYTVSISLESITNKVKTGAQVNFRVVPLEIVDNGFEYYNPINGIEKTMTFTCNTTCIQGYDSKLKFYIDGEYHPEFDFNLTVSDATDISTMLDLSYLWVNNYNNDYKHNLQVFIESVHNVTHYYSSTLYYDFTICPDGIKFDNISGNLIDTNNNVYSGTVYNIMLSAKLRNLDASSKFIISPEENVMLNFAQFNEGSFDYAIYDTRKLTSNINILIDEEKLYDTTLERLQENNFRYTPTTSGDLRLSIVASRTDNAGNLASDNINVILSVEKSPLNINEFGTYSGNLVLRLEAKNKTNLDSNAASWEFKSLAGDGKIYKTTFNNVKFNEVSGWNKNALVLTQGATIDIDVNPFGLLPLGSITRGMTFEIEFETADIKKSGVTIMDYNDGFHSAAIRIKSDSASFTSNSGATVSTNYKDGERIKLAFVINPITSSTAPRLMYIINNGILERVASYNELDSFISNNNFIRIGNPDGDVTVKIYTIRVYSMALTLNNELSNYLYDLPTDQIITKSQSNDVLRDNSEEISFDKVKNKIPCMVFKGPYNQLRKLSTKKESKLFHIEYTNPEDPTYDFACKYAYITKQGTSSIKYPVPNFRVYLEKRKGQTDGTNTKFKWTGLEKETDAWHEYADAYIHPQTGKRVEKQLKYSFKPNALPAKTFTIKADYAESSMTHNTGIARWYNEMLKACTVDGEYKLRTKAQQAVADAGEKYPWDIRTTVDGFPICVFVKDTSNFENTTGLDTDETLLTQQYVGTFVFNNDKTSTDVFGFKSIKLDEVGPDGKQIKIFDNDNVICWEGSANGEAIAKGRSIRFDIGASEQYDASTVDDRVIFASIETRYPDEDDYVTSSGVEISGNLFNNTASYESMQRFLNFCEPAVDIKIAKFSGGYVDGYNYSSWKVATAEDIASGKAGTLTLYIKTNIASEGTADTYEPVAPNQILTTGNITYYVQNTDINYDHVEKTVNTKPIGKEVAIGTIKNWQYYALRNAITTRTYGKISLSDADVEYLLQFYEGEDLTGSNVNAQSHDVKVILTFEGSQPYYIDGFGNKQAYLGQYERISGYKNSWTYMDFFNNCFNLYFDTEKIAGYYSFVRRFNAVDQVVKNTMWTTEDNQHFYLIHYDNDTIIGVRNDSVLAYNWDCDRNTYDHTINNWAFAGFDCVLWNNLEMSKGLTGLMNTVYRVDNALTKITDQSKALKYDTACYWLDNMQSDKWSERLYNYSEEFKYITPYTEDKTATAYLAFLQGNRKSHRHWWLRKRFDLVDAEWMSGEYDNFYIGFYSGGAKNGDELFRLKPASNFYYGYKSNTDIKVSGVYGTPEDIVVIRAVAPENGTIELGDPLRLLGPYQIDTLDFSNNTHLHSVLALDGDGKSGSYISTRGTQLRNLIIGSAAHATTIDSIAFLGSMSLLEKLDITNVKFLKMETVDITALHNLKQLLAGGSSITTFNPSQNSEFDKIVLPNSIQIFNANNIKFNSYDTLVFTPTTKLQELTLANCEFYTNNDSYDIVKTWLSAILNNDAEHISNYKLNLSGIDWVNNYNTTDFVNSIININKLNANISGRINFGQLDFDNYQKLLAEFGEDCFANNGNLKFEAAKNHYLYSENADKTITQAERTINTGKTIQFSTQMFPLDATRDYVYRLYNLNEDGKTYSKISTTNTGYTERTDAEGHTICEYSINNTVIKLNSWTGNIVTTESEKATSLYVGIADVNNPNSRIQDNGSKPILVNFLGVTLPKNITLKDSSNNVILKTDGTDTNQTNIPTFDSSEDKIINVTYSSKDNGIKLPTDADIKSVTATYSTNGYVKATYKDNVIKVELTKIPTHLEGNNKMPIDITLKVTFDSNLEGNVIEFNLTVNLQNITPKSYNLVRYEYKDESGKWVPFNGEENELVKIPNAIYYSWNNTEVREAQNNPLVENGVYKYFIKYYTGFNTLTKSDGIVKVNVRLSNNANVLYILNGHKDSEEEKDVYVSYLNSIGNDILIDGTDSFTLLYYNQNGTTLNTELALDVKPVLLNPNGSTSILTKKDTSESSNIIKINSVYPYNIKLKDFDINTNNNQISTSTFISYGKSKTVSYSYELLVDEGYEENDINTVFDIKLGELNKEQGSIDYTAVNKLTLVNNDKSKFTINIASLSEEENKTINPTTPLIYSLPITLGRNDCVIDIEDPLTGKQRVKIQNKYFINNKIYINAYYSYSSATSREELEEGLNEQIFYLYDNTGSYWKIDNGISSSNWDNFNNKLTEGTRILGVGFKKTIANHTMFIFVNGDKITSSSAQYFDDFSSMPGMLGILGLPDYYLFNNSSDSIQDDLEEKYVYETDVDKLYERNVKVANYIINNIGNINSYLPSIINNITECKCFIPSAMYMRYILSYYNVFNNIIHKYINSNTTIASGWHTTCTLCDYSRIYAATYDAGVSGLNTRFGTSRLTDSWPVIPCICVK